jgi:hypothetical protein
VVKSFDASNEAGKEGLGDLATSLRSREMRSMFKKLMRKETVALFILCFAVSTGAHATRVLFYDDFETGWSGDYAPGWVNAAYRHGDPPIGQMMQQVDTSYSGSYGMRLTASSVPQDWMWWASVEVGSLEHWALDRQWSPKVSVMYYDQIDLQLSSAGQVYAVPDWVNPYINGSEDWTDVQFGGRFNQITEPNDDYYYVAVGEGHPGWQNTGVRRSPGWVELAFQLSADDGRIHFYIDDVHVGASYRDDYTNLGTSIGLYTMFEDPLSAWSDQPYTIWDDFKVETYAPVPEPASMVMLGMLGAGMAATRLRRRNKK